jgi:hypothetical protein
MPNNPNNPIYNTPKPLDLEYIFEDKKQHVKLKQYISKFIDYDKEYPRGLKQAYDEALDKNAFYKELAGFIDGKGKKELRLLVEVLQKSSEERTTPKYGTDETLVTDLINEIDLISAYNVPEPVTGNAGPLYNEIQTELKFEDFFEEEEIKKLRKFIEDTAGVFLNKRYGRANGQDTFYKTFENSPDQKGFYSGLGEWLKKNKQKGSEDLDLLIELLTEPSKRTQENLEKLKNIIDEHSKSPKYVYEEKVVYNPSDEGESTYEEPVLVTEGEDVEELYATIEPKPKPKIKFKKTRDFPGFWGDEDKGLEGGDY